jgi:hypothetical protein
VIEGEQVPTRQIPPPLPDGDPFPALLSVIVHDVIAGEELEQYIPPPKPDVFAFPAMLPEIVHEVIVGEELEQYIPPP